MNTQPVNSGGGVKGETRPVVIIGIVAVAALVVLAAVVLLKPNTPVPGVEAASGRPGGTTASEGLSPAGTQPGHSAPLQPGLGAASPTGAVAHAAVDGQMSVSDLIKALKDGSLPMSERKAAIQALAKLGTPEAIAALKEALASGSEELRVAVAEGLGECASPECSAMLLGLLNDPSQAIVQAAIRGLAQLGSPEAVTALTQLLNDSLRSGDIRSEAATGLGTVAGPGAMAALAQAAMTLGDEDLVTQVLNAIGGRDVSETQPFFQQYMGSAVSSDLRVAAIESLWQAKGDPTAFLTGYISDSDAEVRASAAWQSVRPTPTATLARSCSPRCKGSKTPMCGAASIRPSRTRRVSTPARLWPSSSGRRIRPRGSLAWICWPRHCEITQPRKCSRISTKRPHPL